MMHPLVSLAREAVEVFVREKRSLPVPDSLEEHWQTSKSGVFVCLKKEHQLRGCIGTIMPVTESIAEETIRNAVAAASDDPRFPPVDEKELEGMTYTVDVLSAPEEVADIRELDPKKYGIILVKDSRRGLLLPDLEGVESVEQQISIAKMKAGIMSDEGMKIFRFTVHRYA